MEHLDDARLAALLDNPSAHRALVAHLDEGCAQCDAFLAGSGPDALDGLADAALLRAAPAATNRRAARPLRRRLAAVAALAAVVTVGVVVARLRPVEPAATGLKGPASRRVLEVSAVARGEDGALRRVETGDAVAARETLLLRTHANEAGTASLWLASGDAPPRHLGDVPLSAGTQDLRVGDALAGISLADESGQVTVWVVSGAGTPSLAPAEAQRRLESGETRDVAVGRLVFEVTR